MQATRMVALNHGLSAQVDEEDWIKVKDFRWHAILGGNSYYAITNDPRMGKKIRMHRLIMGVTDPAMVVDHRNLDGLDNRRCNLRVCTTGQNTCNARRHRDSTSPHKGIFYQKDKEMWVARIFVNGKRRRLGYFETAEEAALAYDRAAKKYYGEFARLNFPPIEEAAAA